MSNNKTSSFFCLSSKVSAIMTAPAIALSTAATVALFPLTALLSLIAGKWREKYRLITNNPVALVFFIFYGMFLIGVVYTSASSADIALILRKYLKFLLAPLFLPLFIEEKWRDYAINAFLIGVGVFLVILYVYMMVRYPYKYYITNPDVKIFLKNFLRFMRKNLLFKSRLEISFLLAFAAYFSLLKVTFKNSCRYLWLGFFVATVYILIFNSTGRSGYFVFAGLMVLFFVQKFSWRGLLSAIITLSLLFGLAFFVSPTFNKRINRAFIEVKTYQQGANTSVGARITFAKYGLKMIKERPFFGYGTGSFNKRYKEINPRSNIAVRNPHNEYVHIMVQFGMFGLLVLLLFFGVPVWYSRFLPEQEKYIARGVVLGIMLGCFANSWLLDVTEGCFYAYFIMVAFGGCIKVARLKRRARHSERSEESP